jgi:hypothetical protein
VIANFLSVVVSGAVSWPDNRKSLTFDGVTLTLLPQTAEHDATLHVDMSANRLSPSSAYTVLNRFLSALAWEKDSSAFNEGGWSGGHLETPSPQRRRVLAGNWARLFPNASPAGVVQKRALSLYREALNAQDANLPTFAVLGYFRILEMNSDGEMEAARRWIGSQASHLAGLSWIQDLLKRIASVGGRVELNNYLVGQCRAAVAHATRGMSKFDPDDVTEVRRMSDAAELLQYLARRFIITELEVEE